MDENTKNWRKYYEKALSRPHHPRTEFVVKSNESSSKIAIDCGCGTGSDIAYLNEQGFDVFGFDVNADSISICRDRFGSTNNVYLSQESFETFNFQSAGIVIANSSLFFADPAELGSTMQKITSSVDNGGIFAGDFLGYKDSWANGFRVPTAPVTKKELLEIFTDFDILAFSERDEVGKTLIGMEKHWHTYSLVVQKRT
ncbi:class I SAM-dependent methyltransferase [Vibrio vulnificus]|uniref:class I SAM-dependent methyltransferase n=1 Tax=Vibrio vulnificus TaxID=672 RepID=UPI001CDBD94D|nr:class I SAM-dependent methyltransferase [Vibrio vulnificus]MCA3883149.1 class I SAM-dependent methyltransferase [Vibrio vulnificus]MCA3949475.1 class I SAM-dependent methyltransferase [Vibrio vulnificus]